MAVVKLSSKRQITLPARVCRALNLKQGDRLTLEIKDNKIIFTRLPEDFTNFFSGIAKGIYGKSPQEIKDYVRKEREAWEK